MLKKVLPRLTTATWAVTVGLNSASHRSLGERTDDSDFQCTSTDCTTAAPRITSPEPSAAVTPAASSDATAGW